jgi:HD-GYP domain-containing protein (c-di-GMP phosphodiesterase class II)
MDEQLAAAQTLRYAEELRRLHLEERAQRCLAEEALARLQDSYATTVRALAAALELRDDQTGGHAERVADLGLRLARQVAPELAADPELEYGFLLHDIGKIGVPDAILLKPGPLSAPEMTEMRFHTVLGELIIEFVPYLNGLARQVIGAHHERWDGGGYPQRLAGEGIPPAARIFSVVDAFDAMTHDRPYRSALPLDASLREIAECAGKQFDPAVAEAFLALEPELRRAA